MSSLLNRNYYTIAHDLNPSDEKQEKPVSDDRAIAYTADEPSFLSKVKFYETLQQRLPKITLQTDSLFIPCFRVVENYQSAWETL